MEKENIKLANKFKYNNFAFIFARGGSKGLKNKNTRTFLKTNLLAQTLLFAKKSNLFDKIFLSSENKKILKIGKKLGAYCILRPKFLATDNSAELLSWKHAISHVEKKIGNFRTFISLPVTSPLRKLSDIKKALKLLNSKPSSDLILGYANTNKHPEFNMVKIKKNKTIEKYLNKTKYFNRQSAPKIYELTTSFYIAKPNYVKKTSNILNGKIYGIKIPRSRSIDIDDYFDFKISEYILKNKLNI